MKYISFVIPCYRSENTIEIVISELIATITNGGISDYEIILVNDCSPDDVWKVIQHLSEKNPKIKGISLSRNFGQHAALMAGYAYCEGDYVVSLDDDGQMPLEVLLQMIEQLDSGYDVACTYYEEEIKKSLYRKFGTWIAEKMSKVMLGAPKDFKSSSFYIARKFVIKEMIRYKNAYPYLAGLLLRTTKNIAYVPARHRERLEGSSGYSMKKLLALWLNGFTAFSVIPLRFASFLGIFCSFIGFFIGILAIVRKLMNPDMLLGYSSTIASIFFVGGVIMMILGMIGEYIGRIYISINNAPIYVIKETTEMDELINKRGELM